jgi:hypothetical protein
MPPRGNLIEPAYSIDKPEESGCNECKIFLFQAKTRDNDRDQPNGLNKYPATISTKSTL